jgi:hypothetical protein
MIKLTVGRVVWYYPGEGDAPIEHGDQPLAALIAYVWSDRMVNLAVFDADGRAHNRMSVILVQDDNDKVSGAEGYATWLPYQKGQAAKTEQLEAQLAAAKG